MIHYTIHKVLELSPILKLYDIIGVLIHEMTHYTMQIVYKNVVTETSWDAELIVRVPQIFALHS